MNLGILTNSHNHPTLNFQTIDPLPLEIHHLSIPTSHLPHLRHLFTLKPHPQVLMSLRIFIVIMTTTIPKIRTNMTSTLRKTMINMRTTITTMITVNRRTTMKMTGITSKLQNSFLHRKSCLHLARKFHLPPQKIFLLLHRKFSPSLKVSPHLCRNSSLHLPRKFHLLPRKISYTYAENFAYTCPENSTSHPEKSSYSYAKFFSYSEKFPTSFAENVSFTKIFASHCEFFPASRKPSPQLIPHRNFHCR
jgi:hypothetical protein